MSYHHHEKFMAIALELAAQALGDTSPNPMVGAVLVNPAGEIIGRGWHKKAGSDHAEVGAIKDCNNEEALKTATMYVTLEPCSHYGKTPPCADLIIAKGIPNVVVACVDPFEEVAGRGIEKLRRAGIEVTVGVMEAQAKELNRRFFTFVEKKRPYIILKWAQSSDGAIDIVRTATTPPAWFTGPDARKLVHQWRAQEDAIMVGRITAQNDDPALTVRDATGKNPIRVVIDRKLQLPHTLKLFADNQAPTLLFTDVNAPKIDYQKQVTIVKIDFTHNIIPQILAELHYRKIESMIVEGGTRLLQSFIDQNLWDEARIFTAQHPISHYYAAIKNQQPLKAPQIAEFKIQDKINLENSTLEIIRALTF